MSSPLSLVKDQFGDKEKLVAAVQALATEELWIDRVSEAKGLAHVSNAKLLKLHAALSTAQKEFGSRAKLIDSIATLAKREKDQGFKQRLERFPLPRLLAEHSAAALRHKRAQAKPATTAPKKRLVRSKKARAKAAQ